MAELNQNKNSKQPTLPDVALKDVSVLLSFFMILASNVPQMLLDTYKHHTEGIFSFTILVSMSKPRSIYVVYM